MRKRKLHGDNGSPWPMPLQFVEDEDAIVLRIPVKNWLGFRVVDQPLGGDAHHIFST
jgi:hypothetical protein